MNLILYSSSIQQLDNNRSTTSSENFELSLIKHMSIFFDKIYIISKKANKLEVSEDNKIKLINIKDKSFFKNEILDILNKENISKTKKNIILFFGYDYCTIKSLKSISKLYNSRIISFTFDTHKGSNSNRGYLKRKIVDLYFGIGISKLNSIDGIILFKEDAYIDMKLNIPYIVSRMGIDKLDISNYVYKNKDKNKFKIIYAGSLEDYNGIELMIEAINNIKSDNIRLEIYGEGVLLDYVIKNKSKNIIYKGKKSRYEISEAIKGADLLLNLRDPNSIVDKYAFPSKLIEYMASGVPTITSNIIDNDELFYNSVFVLDKYDYRHLAKLIFSLINDDSVKTRKTLNSKKYLEKNHLWEDISYELYVFLSNI